MDELFSVRDKTVLITGGSSGLGLQLVRLFSRHGARVCSVAKSHDPKVCDGLLDAVRFHAPQFIIADLRDDIGVQRAFAEAIGHHGIPQIIFNNAGLTQRKRFMDVSREDWNMLAEVNVKAVFFVAQEGARLMKTAKLNGSIINTGSILASRAMTGTSVYSSTKAAIAQMTRSMAYELGPYGIRVNCLAPGWFETRMTSEFLPDPAKAFLKGANPLRRLGPEGDLDGAALLLASDAGRYITGTTITVDGGQSLSG